MVLTQEDLQEWNSHPVTKAVFAKVKEEAAIAREQSTMMETADMTAQRTAFKEGFVSGAESLTEAYELTLEEVTE